MVSAARGVIRSAIQDRACSSPKKRPDARWDSGVAVRRDIPPCHSRALSDNPSRFFYAAMGGMLVAESTERMWGRRLRQSGYGWRDLERWLAARGIEQR